MFKLFLENFTGSFLNLGCSISSSQTNLNFNLSSVNVDKISEIDLK